MRHYVMAITHDPAAILYLVRYRPLSDIAGPPHQTSERGARMPLRPAGPSRYSGGCRRPQHVRIRAMMRIRIAILAVAGGVAAGLVSAAAPLQVALVENVTGNPVGAEFMDYLETGKIVELGPRDTVVLSYMSSCVRETITGGTVTIGTDRSEVQAGKVARTTVPCDAGKMLLAADQAAQFG